MTETRIMDMVFVLNALLGWLVAGTAFAFGFFGLGCGFQTVGGVPSVDGPDLEPTPDTA